MANKNLIEIEIEILILVVMIKPMFGLSLLTGIGFLAAIAGSIYDRSLFSKPNMVRFILGGTILTYAASQIFFTGLKSKEIFSFVIISLIALSIWLRGYFLKKGVILK